MWKFELWHEGNCLHEEEGFETEAEAEEEGQQSAKDRIEMWKADDAWHGENVEDFDIKVIEFWPL